MQVKLWVRENWNAYDGVVNIFLFLIFQAVSFSRGLFVTVSFTQRLCLIFVFLLSLLPNIASDAIDDAH